MDRADANGQSGHQQEPKEGDHRNRDDEPWRIFAAVFGIVGPYALLFFIGHVPFFGTS